MAVYDNVTEKEILSIIAGEKGQPSVKYRWECILTTEAGELSPYKVVSVYWFRDYVTNFADEMRIDILVPPGEYERKIVPYSDNIDVVVRRVPVFIDRSGNEAVDKADVQTRYYKGVIDDTRSIELEGNYDANKNAALMDQHDVRPVTVTLMDKAVEQLKIATVGGAFKEMRPTELLKFLFSHVSANLQLDQSFAVKGVDVVQDVEEAEAFPQFGFRHLDLLKDTPFLLQKGHGVYFTGIGRYFQNQIWYIYPTYSTRRFTTATRKLTILNLPSNMVGSLPKSSRYIDGHLYVLSTEESVSSDPSVAALINRGNGTRYLKASRLFNGMVKSGGNKAVASRRENTAEYIAVQQKTGINFAPLSEEPVTSSHAFESSRIAAMKGEVVQVGWDSAEPEKITPGMPVRFLIPTQGGNVKQRFGCILAVEANVFDESRTVVNTSHVCKAALTVFLEKETD